MVLRSLPRAEGAQVSPLASLRTFLPRIQPIFTRFQFSNHKFHPLCTVPRREIKCRQVYPVPVRGWEYPYSPVGPEDLELAAGKETVHQGEFET